jgi:hypothetical protein
MFGRLQDQRGRSIRLIGYACLLAIVFSFAYLPIETPLSHGSITAAVVVHKDIRLHHPIAKSALPLDLPPQGWIAESWARFLKVDRKQNLRLWPVIDSGLTRSPPLSNLA